MKYQVKEISKNEIAGNSLYLESSLHLLNKVYGNELRSFALTDKGENTVALFSIYSFNKLWQKHIITPPFLTDIQLKTNCTAENASQITNFNRDVLSSIALFLKKLPHTYLELVLPRDISDALPFKWNDFKVGIRYSYFLDLTKSEENLIKNMSTQRRKNIKDANKLDLGVKRISDPKIIFEKAKATLTSKNAKFNENIVGKFSELADSDNLVCVGIYDRNELIALSASYCTPDEATYLFGWNNGAKGMSFAGTYALWNCILECKKISNSFNFAGSQIPSIEKYFRGFGGTLTPLISAISDKRKLTKQFT